MMTEDTMKKSAEEAFNFLPEKPVSKGEKWQRKLEVPLGPLGSLASIHNYTYEGMENKLAKISVTATMTYNPPKADAGGQLPFQITKGNLKADDAKGTILFDPAAGRLASSSMTMRIKGSLTISAMGQELAMDMDQNQDVKIEVSDKPPAAK
jgi:hypothetical protein